LKEPLFILKSSDGKRDEVIVTPEEVFVSRRAGCGEVFMVILFDLTAFVVFAMMFESFFLWPVLRGAAFLLAVCLLIFYIHALVFRRYLIDFKKKRVFFVLFRFIRIPLLSFGKIGGIDKPIVDFVDHLRGKCFYKIWRRGHRFEGGIPLTDIRDVFDAKNKKFEEEFIPFIKSKMGITERPPEHLGEYRTAGAHPIKPDGGEWRGCYFYEDEGKIYFQRGVNFGGLLPNFLACAILIVLCYFILVGSMAKWWLIAVFVMLCLFYLWRRERFSRYFFLKRRGSDFVIVFRDGEEFRGHHIENFLIQTNFYGTSPSIEAQSLKFRLYKQSSSFVRSICVSVRLCKDGVIREKFLEAFYAGELYKAYIFMDYLKYFFGEEIPLELADNDLLDKT
jgi:hypothetical protein